MPDADRFALPDLATLAPPAVDFWSLRMVEETSENYTVRKDVALPFCAAVDRGAMATVYAGGGYGYAATGDTSPAGLRAALERAAAWARATARFALVDWRTLPRPAARGEYASPSLDAPLRSRREWFDLLMAESRAAAVDAKIVDWEANVEVRHATHRLVTGEGGDLVQRYRFLLPAMSVTAHADGDTQTRTLHGYRGICQQGGDEILARFGFTGSARRIAEEALELLAAPNCPTGTMDVLLMPDQMILQIHESIGHPLELDRILGDERNFAGTSFVTPDMFGSYRYGSDLLNVTFDPTRTEELGSYGWDDDGTKAEKVHLIRKGILERPQGGAISQARAGLPGTSNSRADGWNRPPIDRMANLNLEPGDATLDEMIGGIERGVLMETNCSWSIDDSRNKFQFGCERGRLIENGRLGAVVKNPNYRGISANFWRSLARVGNADTAQVLGTPYCGKGEPGQAIRVGHASPACVFTDVAVFGGRHERAGRSQGPKGASASDCLRPRQARRVHRPSVGGRVMAPREQAAPAATMESYFRDVAASLDGLVQAGETYTACFSAEISDFVRMNSGKVRQPGSVVQRYLGIDLIRGARHALYQLSLAGDPATDRPAIAAAVAAARAALADAADDPHLLIATDVHSSREARGGPLPPAETIVDAALDAARGTDLVGLYAGGPMYRGFANSHGQRNWHEAHTFSFQWSLYHRADKAVKSSLSGFSWHSDLFAAKMDAARAELAHMTRPAKALTPGRYRAFLTPAAMEDVASMMCWGGFSARALATKQSSLTRMQDANGDAPRLDPRVAIAEATAEGVAPAFQAEGFVRPARVPLIEAGRLVGSLVSPRTAREFGLEANGANGFEGPESLAMAPGTLPAKDALATLGTGLYVGNLHYLNYSDRPAARITGMTRFATFWVEDGRIVAPVDVLRFDDTLYRMLGANLEALTTETELLLASDSYRERQLASMRLPGALLSEVTFTL